MRRRQRQMNRVRRDGGWNDLLVKKSRDQRTGFRRDSKAWQPFQKRQPFGGKIRVAICGFFQHDFGNKQVVFLTMLFPPSPRRFLIGS